MINKIFSFINKHLYLIIIIILIVQVGLIFSNQFTRMFNSDEFESVQVAWKINQGQSIYTDFFEHHHPFFYYLLTPLVHLGQEPIPTLYLARLFIFVNLLILYFLTYKIASLLLNKSLACFSLLILNNIIYFLVSVTEIRPDNLQITFSLLSFWLLLLAFKNNSKLILALSAVSLAVSFLFLQKAVFFIAPIGLILFWRLKQKKLKIPDILIYVFFFIATLGPYIIYLLISGNFSVYITNFWLFNFFINVNHPATKFYFFLLVTSPISWFLFSLGLYSSYKNKKTALLYLSFIVVFILSILIFKPSKLNQHYTIIAPFVAVMAAYGLNFIFQKEKRATQIIIVFLAIFPLVFLPIVQFKASNLEQIKRIKYVMNKTSEDDFVFDGSNYFNLFRNDIDYFWSSLRFAVPTMKRLTGYEYDVYESIDKVKPKIIYKSNLKLSDPRIKDNYTFSDVYDDILIRNKE